MDKIIAGIALLCSYLSGAPALECREWVMKCAEQTAETNNAEYKKSYVECRMESVTICATYVYSRKIRDRACDQQGCMSPIFAYADYYVDDCFKKFRK